MAGGANALAIGSALIDWGRAASPEAIGLDLSGLKKKDEQKKGPPNPPESEAPETPRPGEQTELTMEQIAQGDTIHKRQPNESDTWPKGLDHVSFEEFKVAAANPKKEQCPLS